MAWPCRPERAPAAPNWSVSSRPASRCGPGADARVGLGAGFRRRIQELDKKYRSVQKRVLTRFIRSEEHTSELQSLMRISYAVFCLKKKNKQKDKDSRTLLETQTATHQNQVKYLKKIQTHP